MFGSMPATRQDPGPTRPQQVKKLDDTLVGLRTLRLDCRLLIRRRPVLVLELVRRIGSSDRLLVLPLRAFFRLRLLALAPCLLSLTFYD